MREFGASQLGNEMQMQSALRGGTQEMMSAATTSLASVVKEFGLLDFPFAVSSPQAEALVAGPFGQAMTDTLPEKDLIGLGYWGLDSAATNSSRPIAKVEDSTGLKLRVIPNPVFLETFKGSQGQPGADEFRRTLHGSREQDRRWAGKSYTVICQTSSSSCKNSFGDHPRLHAEHPARQPESWDKLSPDAEGDPRRLG